MRWNFTDYARTNLIHASSAGLTQIRFEGLPYGSQPERPMRLDTPGDGRIIVIARYGSLS